VGWRVNTPISDGTGEDGRIKIIFCGGVEWVRPLSGDDSMLFDVFSGAYGCDFGGLRKHSTARGLAGMHSPKDGVSSGANTAENLDAITVQRKDKPCLSGSDRRQLGSRCNVKFESSTHCATRHTSGPLMTRSDRPFMFSLYERWALTALTKN
jgi:hypothetical protein